MSDAGHIPPDPSPIRIYRYVMLEDIPAYLAAGWTLGKPASVHSVFMWAPAAFGNEADKFPEVAA